MRKHITRPAGARAGAAAMAVLAVSGSTLPTATPSRAAATGSQVLLNDNGYGAGNGEPPGDDPSVASRDVLSPALPMNRYSKGILYMPSIPSDIGDLYSKPPGGTRPVAETVPGSGRNTVTDVAIPPHGFRVYNG